LNRDGLALPLFKVGWIKCILWISERMGDSYKKKDYPLSISGKFEEIRQQAKFFI